VTTIVLVGLMLLALAMVAVIANSNKGGGSAPEGDEIVLPPEEVSIDEGSLTLNAAYSTTQYEYLHASGYDAISLVISKDEDSTNKYSVTGVLVSMQKVSMDGMDQGHICTVEILHKVTYTVLGSYTDAGCKFDLSVKLTPSSSQLLAEDCSVDINLDPSKLYLAPLAENLVFTNPSEARTSGVFTFTVLDVILPRGAKCSAYAE